ncbi:MAG TPA: ATP-binding protein [Planctomycetota bacterium]|nr:ATP-binding protein [Planctomycetota bacterium]
MPSAHEGAAPSGAIVPAVARLLATSREATLVIERGGRILGASQPLEALLGHQARDLVGREIEVIVPERRRASRPRIIQSGEDLEGWLRGPGPDAIGVREDGSELAIDVQATDLEPGILALTLRPARHGLQGEDRDAVVEECLRQLAERMREVLWVSDKECSRILYVGAAYETIWGRTRESLFANPLSWLETIHPEDQPAVRQAFLSRPRNLVANVYRIVRPDGSIRWIRDRGATIDGVGPETLLAGIAEDITELKEAEESLRRTEARLRQAEKLDAIGRLAGGVAHDFNNQLAVIVSYAELVLQRAVAPNIAADVRAIVKAAESAAELTSKLLAFSRQRAVAPRTIDLNATIRDMHRMLERLVGEDVVVRLELCPRAGSIVADPGDLEQVLLNLAVNARDAMPEGGTLLIATAHADEGAPGAPEGTAPGGWATLRVKDTGVGIDPEVKKRLFEPFVTTKTEGRGTGLGLSIVYGIVTQARGHITVESPAREGTTVTIHLPCVPAKGDDRPPGAPPAPRGTESLLVVEDNEPFRDAMVRSLVDGGYRVASAQTGPEALEVAGRLGRDLDVLVTDVVMPQMRGEELAARLIERFPRLRVIFISGFSSATEKPLPVGAGAFLQKPFSLGVLASKVRDLLDAPAHAR